MIRADSLDACLANPNCIDISYYELPLACGQIADTVVDLTTDQITVSVSEKTTTMFGIADGSPEQDLEWATDELNAIMEPYEEPENTDKKLDMRGTSRIVADTGSAWTFPKWVEFKETFAFESSVTTVAELEAALETL